MPGQRNDPQPLNLDGALFLDLETTTDGRLQEVGAVLGDHELRRKAGAQIGDALFELESFSHGARVVVGHNVLDHDLPLLRRVAPRLTLHGLPVLDTLYLSPLAFPENPYHGLVKWYKQDGPGTPQRLGPRQPSDPVEDCKQARELLLDEYTALGQRYPASRGMPSVFRCLLGADTMEDHGGLSFLFQKLGGEEIGPGTAGEILEGLLLGEDDASLCCRTSLRSILVGSLADPAAYAPLAFVSAWLLVAGDKSVIPHWVSRRFPTVSDLVVGLRDDPCDDASCAYCRQAHDPKTQLQAFFPT